METHCNTASSRVSDSLSLLVSGSERERNPAKTATIPKIDIGRILPISPLTILFCKITKRKRMKQNTK